MGPLNMLRHMVQTHGEEFEIERGGQIVAKAKGVRNHEQATGKPYIGFLPETQIQTGDKLKGLVSDETFHVVETGKNVFSGQVTQVKAFYGSGHSKQQPQHHTTINIGSMNNSALQSSSPGAVQKVTFNHTQLTEIREMLVNLKSALDNLDLDNDDRADLENHVETIETQLGKPKPNPSVIRTCLDGAKGILGKIAMAAVTDAGKVLALELLHQMGHLI
jgi:hypothetical protein